MEDLGEVPWNPPFSYGARPLFMRILYWVVDQVQQLLISIMKIHTLVLVCSVYMHVYEIGLRSIVHCRNAQQEGSVIHPWPLNPSPAMDSP